MLFAVQQWCHIGKREGYRRCTNDLPRLYPFMYSIFIQIEIKLKKLDGLRWETLEGDASKLPTVKTITPGVY